MQALRHVPIKRKLILITMLTSCVALLLACAGFVIYEQIMFRRSMVRDVAITAEMIGSNSAAALSFNEPTSAEDTLKFLSAAPHITAACIYNKEGKVFATYLREGQRKDSLPPKPLADTHHFGSQRLDLFRQIVHAGEMIGSVYIQSSLVEMQTRWRLYAIIVATVFLTSILAALLLSSKLQRVISEPVFHLARTVHVVATEKDYSVRATKHGSDELGILIDGFNEMLAQIQAQDNALQLARDHLEKRVEERTRELQQEILEHKRTEQELVQAERKYRSIFENATDGIFQTDLAGRYLSANPALAWIYGYESSDELMAEITQVGPQLYVDRARRKAFEELMQAQNAAWDFVSQVRRKDGRLIWVSENGRVARDEAGNVLYFEGFVKDITEKKKAEAELDAAHRQVVETSRQAGMAEVATAVLHNVGNVLNSVNVSASLVTDAIRKSKVPGLAKAAGLMNEQAANLGQFMTADPKGKQLPDYLKKLAEHLSNEQAAMLHELGSLSKNIEHIKDIVSMQQAYARVSGVAESAAPSELLEDALRMNAGALVRHDVQVIREYGELPKVLVEKHKVLQILVNLISNAKYALDDGNPPIKQLMVRTEVNGNNHFKIAVADNGVGISAENLTRIFAHGFTTKKNGHGFGLHSSALAAKQMGGALHVHSEGTGKGATFTLELPLKLGEVCNG